MRYDARLMLALAMLGIGLFAAVLLGQKTPERIRAGVAASQAIRQLDAQRAPLLRLQQAVLRGRTERLDALREDVETALQDYLAACRYNLQVAHLAATFAAHTRHWLDRLDAGADSISATSEFIGLLQTLAAAEDPIHADILAGQRAEALFLGAMVALGLWLLGLFLLHQRRQRKRLERAERRSAALIEQSPFSIQVFDTEGYTRQVNRAWERMWQTSMDVIARYNVLHDPQLKAKGIMPYVRRAFAGETVEIPPFEYHTAEAGYPDAPDLVRCTRAYMYPIKDEEGRIFEVVLMHEDVTDKLRAEQELRASEARLAEAQRVAHLGCWELDLRSNRLRWSEEIFRIFEIDPQRFEASYEAFLETVHPEDRERVNTAYTESVRNHTPYDIQHRLQMPDGRVKWVHERGVTEYDETGTPLRSLGTVLDITDYKALEAELVRHRDHLEELVARRTSELQAINAELESFSYSVSHDLRAPLRAITGFSRALIEDYADGLDETGRDYLARIERNVQRMTQLIDDLLQLSRTSRAPLQTGPVAIGELADEVVQRLRQAYPDHPVRFENRVTQTVTGDAKLLRILLENLLDNAWKYTGPVPEPQVVFATEEVDGETFFVVQDNGVGFDMAYADKLFGAFQRLHGQEFPGTGIGLATVQRIVHRHGGRIHGEAEPGGGARFRFTLATPMDPDAHASPD